MQFMYEGEKYNVKTVLSVPSLCITKFESDKSWNHPDPHQTAAK